MADRTVRMYNPTHRLQRKQAPALTDEPVVQWRNQLKNAVREVAVWHQTVYASINKTGIVALSLDGTEQWRFKTDAGMSSSPAVVD
ncbi:hypothetical protein ACOJIV_27370, partial [Haloarcula sp. AONF1]